MEPRQASFVERVKNNEGGLLYVIVGLIAGFISWFVVPIVGLISVYCGVKLYLDEGELVAGGLIAVLGFVGVALWVAWLASL